jgi:hypothetical protein
MQECAIRASHRFVSIHIITNLIRFIYLPIICIRSSLLCEPESLRVAFATRCDGFVHTTGKTWYKVLYQHTMYVISLLNISIKTYYNGRIKINKFGQYSQEDYILSMTSRYFLQFHSMRLFNVYSFMFCITNSRSYSHFQWHRFNICGNCKVHIS